MRGTAGRRSLDGVAGLEVGDHLCWAYRAPAELYDGVARYIAEGLEAGHRIACFLPSEQLDPALAHLRDRLPGVTDALARGQVIMDASEDAYLPGGRWDPDLRLGGFVDLVEGARADGYAAFRVLGEATAVAQHPAVGADWFWYESRADVLASRMPFIAVCAYDRGGCADDVLEVVDAVHRCSSATWDPRSIFHVHAGDGGSLALGGEIDFLNADVIGRITADIGGDLARPVVDLSGLRFIDVAGMRAVLKGSRSIAEAHERVTIRNAGPTFARLWQLLACDRLVDAEFERT